MNTRHPIVLHPEETTLGPAMPGTERRHFYDPKGAWIGWSGWIRNQAGQVSGWHHHAANETHVYVIRGSVTVHFGPGGAQSLVARAGDFFIIPSQTIHKEVTGTDADLEAFVLRVGGEPEQVDVDGPEPGVG
jgi:uncharacterized RmlC-like cupin family protein